MAGVALELRTQGKPGKQCKPGYNKAGGTIRPEVRHSNTDQQQQKAYPEIDHAKHECQNAHGSKKLFHVAEAAERHEHQQCQVDTTDDE